MAIVPPGPGGELVKYAPSKLHPIGAHGLKRRRMGSLVVGDRMDSGIGGHAGLSPLSTVTRMLPAGDAIPSPSDASFKRLLAAHSVLKTTVTRYPTARTPLDAPPNNTVTPGIAPPASNSAAEQPAAGFEVLCKAIEEATAIFRGLPNDPAKERADPPELAEMWKSMGEWLERLKVSRTVDRVAFTAHSIMQDAIRASDRAGLQPGIARCKAIYIAAGQALSLLAVLLPKAARLCGTLLKEIKSCIFLASTDDAPLPPPPPSHQQPSGLWNAVKPGPAYTGTSSLAGRAVDKIRSAAYHCPAADMQRYASDDSANVGLGSDRLLAKYDLPELITERKGEAEARCRQGVAGECPYFQAASVLAKRLCGNKQSVNQLMRQSHKEALVLERVVKVWQLQLVGRLFTGWRSLRASRRLEDERRNTMAGIVRKNMHWERLLGERGAKEDALAARAQAAEKTLLDSVTEHAAIVDSMTAQAADLRQRLRAVEAQLRETRVNTTQTAASLARQQQSLHVLLSKLAAPTFEEIRRGQLAAVVAAVNETPLHTEKSGLLKWVNQVMQYHPSYTSSYQLRSFEHAAVPKRLDALFLTAAALSPYHCPPAEVLEHFDLKTAAEKAKNVLRACARIGVRVPLTAGQLHGAAQIDGRMLPLRHCLAAALLFERFACGAGRDVALLPLDQDDPSLVCGVPPVLSEDGFGYGTCEQTAEQWEAQFSQSQEQAALLASAGRAAVAGAWTLIAEYRDDEGDLEAEEKRDLPRFVGLRLENVQPPLPSDEKAAAGITTEEDVSCAVAVVKQHYASLRRIFRAAAVAGDQPTVAVDDVAQLLLHECRVPSRLLTKDRLGAVLDKCTKPALPATEWVETLVRVATVMRYANLRRIFRAAAAAGDQPAIAVDDVAQLLLHECRVPSRLLTNDRLGAVLDKCAKPALPATEWVETLVRVATVMGAFV
eukprot:gene17696-27244_t